MSSSSSSDGTLTSFFSFGVFLDLISGDSDECSSSCLTGISPLIRAASSSANDVGLFFLGLAVSSKSPSSSSSFSESKRSQPS